MSVATPQPTPKNDEVDEIDVTELVERIEALEKENHTQKEKIEDLEASVDVLAGIIGKELA